MLEFFRKKQAPAEAAQEKKEILNRWDRSMLEAGMTNVVEHMLNDFEGKLPEALIFPDTSARPLFFALQPVFKSLAKIKGIAEPRCYAFNSKRPDEITRKAEIAALSRGENTPINTRRELEASLRDSGVEDNTMDYFLYNAEPEKMKDARSVMKDRASEIFRHEARFNNTSNIAVIDESSEDGATAREIRRAFDMPEMHVYAVLAEKTESLQAGIVVDPHRDAEVMNPSREYRARFSYTGTGAVGVTKSRDTHSKFSARIPHNAAGEVQRQKAQLQKEMRAVGEKVADALEKKLIALKVA